MTTLVTGADGFIGFHVALRLLDQGERVIGLDDLNPYCSPELKRQRLARLEGQGFTFRHVDLADATALDAALSRARVWRIIHLAAQAGRGIPWKTRAPMPRRTLWVR